MSLLRKEVLNNGQYKYHLEVMGVSYGGSRVIARAGTPPPDVSPQRVQNVILIALRQLTML
jgi:hypothetical protein